MPQLVFHRRGRHVWTLPVQGPSAVVGRSAHCDVVVPDSAVAARAVELVDDDGAWRAVDLTGEGLAVNGRRAPAHALEGGERLELGELEATFRLLADDEEDDPFRPRTDLLASEQLVLPRELWVHAELPGVPGSHRAVLLGEQLDIGSAPECGLRLGAPTVSAFHARLTRAGREILLTDAQSTNGIWYQAGRVRELGIPLRARFQLRPWELWVDPASVAAASGCQEVEGMVSAHPAMLALFRDLDRLAGFPGTVNLRAETGTGKDVLAHALHRRSARASRPFLAINCARFSAERAESEIFGHVKGAFTGAVTSKRGAFVRAHGGTLFLDEIAELPPEVQAKLLRVVEDGEVQPMGSEDALKVDVRVISASHQGLPDLVQRGRFRQDLRYRLCDVNVTLPPLRDRKEDLPFLWNRLRERLKPGCRLDLGPAALAKLQAHEWPGNVRELRTVVLRAISRADGRKVAEVDDIEIDVDAPPKPAAPLPELRIGSMTLEQWEAAGIAANSRDVGGNRTAAARELDIDKKTLLKKLEQYGLELVGVGGEDPSKLA